MISRGFVFEEKYGRVLETASHDLARELQRKRLPDIEVARNTATNFLEKYFFEKTGRRPMILPVVVEV